MAPGVLCLPGWRWRASPPPDALLALGRQRFTTAVAQAVTAFAATLRFDQIPPLINTLVDLELDGDTIRRVVERVGNVAEADEQATITALTAEAARPEGAEAEATQPGTAGPVAAQPESQPGAHRLPALAPDALVVSVDGAMAPFRAGHTYHEVKVAVCRPLQRVSPTPTASAASVWQPLQESGYCLGVEPRPAFWARVRAHALQHGLASPTCTLVILLGDGADWIWRDADEYLGKLGSLIIKILDIFHAREHLWAYARSYFDTEIACKAWAEPLNDLLDTDRPGPILAAITTSIHRFPGG